MTVKGPLTLDGTGEIEFAEAQLQDALVWAQTIPEFDAEEYDCQRCYASMSLPDGRERVTLCNTCAQDLLEIFASELPKMLSEFESVRTKLEKAEKTIKDNVREKKEEQ